MNYKSGGHFISQYIERVFGFSDDLVVHIWGGSSYMEDIADVGNRMLYADETMAIFERIIAVLPSSATVEYSDIASSKVE